MVLGKSTLAKIIMGIEKPDSGTILFNGQDITNMPINERAKLGIAFAFQQPVKFKGITVYDLLKLSAKKEITRKEACEILSKVGLYGVDGSKLVCLFKMCLNGLLSVIVYVVVTLYLKVPQSIFHFQLRKKSGV